MNRMGKVRQKINGINVERKIDYAAKANVYSHHFRALLNFVWAGSPI